MSVPVLNLIIYQYADQQIRLRLLDADGEVIPTAGLQLIAGISREPGGDVLADFAVTASDDEWTLLLSHAESAKCVYPLMSWDALLVDGDGHQAPAARGEVRVTAGVTPGGAA